MSSLLENQYLSEIYEYDHIGEGFSHYTDSGEKILEILKSGNLRYGSLMNMNDPHESHRDYLNLSTVGENDIHDLVRTNKEILRNRIKICCGVGTKYELTNAHPLSLNRANITNTSFGQIYSWIMYGNEFNGGCLIFNRPILLRNFKKSFNSVIDDFVVYHESIPRGERLHIEEIGDEKESIIEGYIKRNFDSFFKKHIGWEHENEFRFLIFDDSTDKYLDLPYGEGLKGVFMGFRIDKKSRKEIINQCDRLQIPCFDFGYLPAFSQYGVNLID